MNFSNLVLILSLAAVQQIGSVDTYGKTEAQILTMGEAAWYQFYVSKAGESTYSMEAAYGIYGDVVRKRNIQLLSTNYQSHTGQIKKLEAMLNNYNGQVIGIGRTVSGGGTIWGPIANHAYADCEDLIYSLIRPANHPPAKPATASMVINRLNACERGLKPDPDLFPAAKIPGVKRDLAVVRKTFTEIVKLALQFDKSSSNRILRYCVDEADNLDLSDQ